MQCSKRKSEASQSFIEMPIKRRTVNFETRNWNYALILSLMKTDYQVEEQTEITFSC